MALPLTLHTSPTQYANHLHKIASNLTALPSPDDLHHHLTHDFRSVLDDPALTDNAPPLPSWVASLRPHQIHAIVQIIEAYRAGAQIVILNAPTGAGKTLIAEIVTRLLASPHNLYVATTRSLQAQFTADFPYANLLMGRANYPTYDFPEEFNSSGWNSLDASMCTRQRVTLPACDGCRDDVDNITDSGSEKVSHCTYCHPVDLCPYQVAKADAVLGRLAVTNTAYFMAEANNIGTLSLRPFTIVDEADTLESTMLDRVSISIAPRWVEKWKVSQPARRTKPEAWLDWAEMEGPRLVDRAKSLGVQLAQDRRNQALAREARAARGAMAKVERLKKELSGDLDGWVFNSRFADTGGVEFKPVRIGRFCREDLWGHSGRWLLMSATFINPDLYAEELGVTEIGSVDGKGYRAGRRVDDDAPTPLPAIPTETVSVPAVFPAANRPVNVIPGPKMTHKEKATAWPEMVQWIAPILAHHPDERIVVHSNSYALTRYLHEHLSRLTPPDIRRRLVTYTSGGEREDALAKYRATPGGVIIAPSLDRGIDLPEDDCRVQILAKIPYPNLGDPQINARLYGYRGQEWFSTATVRTIVQMTGRGVRSSTDRATTYIVDGKFMSLYRESRMLFPKWWREAVSFEGIPGIVRDRALTPPPPG